jgi:hypothetical protein
LNTKTSSCLVFLFLVQAINVSLAQSTYQFGALPSLNLNKKLENAWSLNGKIESRQLIQSGQFKGEIFNKNKYVLTDFSLITAKKIGLNSRFTGGYLVRLEDGDVFHRFIQQYIVVQKFSGLRLAHRLSCDQTFSKIEAAEYRLRYRITAEIPLNGESVDPGEFYLKINNEYVNSLQLKEYDLEIRIVPLVGFDITDNFKVETGIDYRINSFITNNARNSYWMNLNFFIDL